VLANRSGILRSSMPDVMGRASICRARITLQQDSPQAALSFLDTQGAHFQVLGLDRLLALILAEQVRVLVLQGESRRAAEVAGRLASLAAAQRPHAEARGEIDYLVALSRVRLALAGHDGQLALEALPAVHAYVEQATRGRSWVRAHLLSAQVHALLGQTDALLVSLQQALEAGARMGLVRTVLDEGQGVLGLLARHQDAIAWEPAVAEYVQALLSRETPAQVPSPLACAARNTVDSPRASLTPRELEILGLVAQAMSNKRIALTLNITFGTVKWNVKNILAKLGVSSRYAAITLARQQGLLK